MEPAVILYSKEDGNVKKLSAASITPLARKSGESGNPPFGKRMSPHAGCFFHLFFWYRMRMPTARIIQGR
jgi:hypothetical protein